jgi:hypothetical protein
VLTTAYAILQFNHSENDDICPKYHLKILKELSQDQLQVKHGHNVRISPIFAVTPEIAHIPLLKEESKVGLFTCQSPSVQLGRLINQCDSEIQQRLWFNHGLSSIVSIGCNDSMIGKIKAIISGDLITYEEWTIRDHLITTSAYKIEKKSEPLAWKDFQVKRPPEIPVDVSYLLDEFEHAVQRLALGSALFSPSDINSYRELVKTTTDIVSNIVELTKEQALKLPSASALAIKVSLLRNQRTLNQLYDWLVQINSALSYLISQAYICGPVLQTDSLFNRYSLFGIGTASKALRRVANQVDSVFRKSPVYDVIKSEYSIAQGFDIGRDIYTAKPENWRTDSNILDSHLQSKSPLPYKPHLYFFSGRLGFKETLFSITAATQSLHAGDTARWNLMTLTHELTHAHVREVLSAVFSMDSHGTADTDAFEEYLNKYNKFHSISRTQKKPSEQFRWSIQDSIRFAIINFCLWVQTCGNATDETPSNSRRHASANYRLPETADQLRYVVASNWKIVNEIMVHVLDFHYFYNGSINTYIDSIWESWSTVPVVLDHMDHYILRTIAAVSSPGHEELVTRFDLASEKLAERIDNLLKRGRRSVVLQSCHSLLAEKGAKNRLRVTSLPYIYLADITKAFLLSSRVHSSLVYAEKDKYVDLGVAESEYSYLLKTGEWNDSGVASIIPFLADRLRRSISDTSEVLPVEYRTAWMFMMAASPPPEVTHGR